MHVNQWLPLGKNKGKGLFYNRRIFLIWFTIWPASPDVVALVVGGRSKPTVPQPESKGGGWSCFILMTVENATWSAAASSKAAGQSDQVAKWNHSYIIYILTCMNRHMTQSDTSEKTTGYWTVLLSWGVGTWRVQVSSSHSCVHCATE